MTRLASLLVLVALTGLQLTSQTLKFEVVSVKTNVSGAGPLSLRSRPDGGSPRPTLRWAFSSVLGAAPGDAVTTTELPSVFTAVQEQLGLRLISSRAPVQVLVIDSVERPTPD